MSYDIVQFHLPHEEQELAPNKQIALCKAAAKVCDIAIDDVHFVMQRVHLGLWVALGVRKAFAFKLSEAFGQATSPLQTAFQDIKCSPLILHQPTTRFEYLHSCDENLLRLLYLGAQQLIIRAELGGGYSGARVLLVEPIDHENRAMTPQIVKLASVEEIAQEQERYKLYVDNHLERITPRLKNHQIWEEKAGLCYGFVDGGVLGRTKTLERFYQAQPSAELIVRTLSDLMVKELGGQWYRQGTPLTIPFAAEYGINMVEHLLLQIRPGSPDGIWPAGQAPTLDAPYQRIDGNDILARYTQIASGTLIHLGALTVEEIKADTLRLYDPDKVGTVVKIRYAADAELSFVPAIGNRIVVRGEVIHNRQARLEAIVLDAFNNYERFALEKPALANETVQWSGGEVVYPNPLFHYPELLGDVLRGHKSLVHGDLHLRNILVDETGRGYLIDFALVAERHNLFDFIKLESYIRQMILSRTDQRFSFTDYLHFEEQLALHTLNQENTPPTQPELQKAYAVITALRGQAARYMMQPPNWQAEYFPSLFLYNLVVLKYYENHGRQAARLAFGTAAVALKYMQDLSLALPPNSIGEEIVVDPKTASQGTRRGIDPYTHLEVGVEALLSKLDNSTPEYDQALALQLRLQQNLLRTRTYLDNSLLSGERAEITDQFNRISRSVLGIPFRDLCS